MRIRQRRYRKTLVALVGAAVNIATSAPVPARWQPWVTALIAIATAAGVYQVPNDDTP